LFAKKKVDKINISKFNKHSLTGCLDIFNPASWSAINVDASNELKYIEIY
jgi:hypothetical protein